MDHGGNKNVMSDNVEKGKEEEAGQCPAEVTAEYNGQEAFGDMRGTVLADMVLDYILKNFPSMVINLKHQSPWLTIREAEDYARVTHGVLAKAIKDGELPAYQRCKGTMMIVSVTDVDEWIRTLWTKSSTTKGTGGNDGGNR